MSEPTGLAIFPNWDAHLEAMKDARLRDAEQLCAKWGHDWHTCAVCGDRSCLRCGLGEP